MTTKSNKSAAISRRTLLKASGVALAMPHLWIKDVMAAQERVVIRSPGGEYDSIRKKLIYDPFTKATGIQVVPVAVTAGKLNTMLRTGQVEVDVIDNADSVLLQWANDLAPIDYANFEFSDPADILPEYKHTLYVGNFIYADTMAYNLHAFNANSVPQDWVEFWDYKKIPGSRALADVDTGSPNIEFALLADGVPKDQLYPLDIERAYRAMSRIRPGITKFWASGALSAHMLTTREVDLSSAWSTRIQYAVNQGAPLAINWNQHLVHVQAYAILKRAKNFENAQKLVDFCLSHAVQTQFSRQWVSGPVTRTGYEALPQELRNNIPGGERTRTQGILLDAEWWAQNRTRVVRGWAHWALQS